MRIHSMLILQENRRRVGEAGVEPAFRGYEPPVVPFHYSPIGDTKYTLNKYLLQAPAKLNKVK